MSTSIGYVMYVSGKYIAFSTRTTHTGHHVIKAEVDNIEQATVVANRMVPRELRNAYDHHEVEFLPVVVTRTVERVAAHTPD